MQDKQLLDQEGIGFITQQFAQAGCTINEYHREVGIDAILEIRDDSYKSSGKFIAIQLKSGESFFEHQDEHAYYYYTGKSRGFHCMPRAEVMRHMMQVNLGLIINRQIRIEKINHTWVANTLVDYHIMETANANAYLFPLYIYLDTDKRDLFSHAKELEKKQPNISSELFATLSEVYKEEPTPEDIFYYIYAVLYSNTYRTKYAEFLKIDFPRIPFPKDDKILSKMAEYGQRIVKLHLLKSMELDPPIAKFQGKGENNVEKLRYDEKEKRVYFNQGQYFEGIKKEIWEYQIGGYQVCNKWLKDRKKRLLSLDDIKHYCKIVTSLQKTIEVQKAIDEIYPEVEKD